MTHVFEKDDDSFLMERDEQEDPDIQRKAHRTRTVGFRLDYSESA